MKILKHLAIVALIFMSSSCANSLDEKISIESCENISLSGFTALKADLGLRNESGRKIELYEVLLTLKKYGGDNIVTLSLRDTITVARRTELFEVATLWKLQDVNILAAMAASKSIMAGDSSEFCVDIHARGKWGWIKREIDYPSMPLSALMNSVDF